MIIGDNEYQSLLSPYYKYDGGTFWTEKFKIRELDLELGKYIRGVFDVENSQQEPFHVSTSHVFTWMANMAMIYQHREHHLEQNTNGGWLRKVSFDCYRSVFKRTGITLMMRPVKKSYATATRLDNIGLYHEVRHTFIFDFEDGAWTGEMKASIHLPLGCNPISP